MAWLLRRARGETVTAAMYFRDFITKHPAYRCENCSSCLCYRLLLALVYRHDSVVTPEIAHDLLIACSKIGDGRLACPEVMGNMTIDRFVVIDQLSTRTRMIIECVQSAN
jgi:hypothetical protein